MYVARSSLRGAHHHADIRAYGTYTKPMDNTPFAFYTKCVTPVVLLGKLCDQMHATETLEKCKGYC